MDHTVSNIKRRKSHVYVVIVAYIGANTSYKPVLLFHCAKNSFQGAYNVNGTMMHPPQLCSDVTYANQFIDKKEAEKTVKEYAAKGLWAQILAVPESSFNIVPESLKQPRPIVTEHL